MESIINWFCKYELKLFFRNLIIKNRHYTIAFREWCNNVQYYHIIEFSFSTHLFQLLWIVTFILVVFLGVDQGLFLSLGFAFITLVVRTQSPHCTLMGRVRDTDIYKDISDIEAVGRLRHLSKLASNVKSVAEKPVFLTSRQSLTI